MSVSLGSSTVRMALVSGQSSPVVKDPFNPLSLVLKARAPNVT